MNRILIFLAGLLVGALALVAATTVLLLFLPDVLVVRHEPVQADAVIVLGGGDGSRLRRGVEVIDAGWAPRLILASGSKQGWARLAQRACPDCRLDEREIVYIKGPVDTRMEAQFSLDYCRQNGLRKVLVVTSPYHSRRSQLVFNDIFAGSGIAAVLLSSGGYGRLVPADGPWWRDRQTVETLWLEFGKILYWELTPFLEWSGEDGQGRGGTN